MLYVCNSSIHFLGYSPLIVKPGQTAYKLDSENPCLGCGLIALCSLRFSHRDSQLTSSCTMAADARMDSLVGKEGRKPATLNGWERSASYDVGTRYCTTKVETAPHHTWLGLTLLHLRFILVDRKQESTILTQPLVSNPSRPLQQLLDTQRGSYCFFASPISIIPILTYGLSASTRHHDISKLCTSVGAKATMPSSGSRWGGFTSLLLVFCIILVLMPGKAHAFGAGNIPSIG